MQNLIEQWEQELSSLREALIVMDSSQVIEYQLLDCEALRLSLCLKQYYKALCESEIT